MEKIIAASFVSGLDGMLTEDFLKTFSMMLSETHATRM
jgi:hypothetical protein